MAHLEAIAGFSVQLTWETVDADDAPAAPDSAPTMKVTNKDRKVLDTQTLSTPASTGTYEVNYVVPESVLHSWEDETEIYAAIEYTMQGIPKLGTRHTITVTWT